MELVGNGTEEPAGFVQILEEYGKFWNLM